MSMIGRLMIAALALGLAAPLPVIAEEAPKAERRVKVLTINLWHDFPSFFQLEKRTRVVGDLIKARQPDLVAIQEAGESVLIKNRCEVLAKQTGYGCKWVAEGGLRAVFAEGPGILSRWPIRESNAVDLPHRQALGLVRRKALVAHIDSPYGPLNFVSAHLSNGAKRSEKRLDQAAKVLALSRSFAGSLPGFIAGDFNETPDAAPMKLMRGELSLNGPASKLKDAWLESRPGDSGFTQSTLTGPYRRIDYVYVSPGAAGYPRVVSCERVLLDPVDGVRASDHAGVLCEFELP